tara:strand:+ start:229 stop:1194 length:966 start_codon:yes stop_codon:yes gene_type:complete
VSSWLNGGLFGGGGINFTNPAGYFMGGYDSGQLDSVDHWSFPADVGTALTITLTDDARNAYGFGNDGVAGYTGIGQGSSSFMSAVDKLTYSVGTFAALGTGLSAAARGQAAMSNVAVAGYVSLGDQSNTYVQTVDKFAYSDDSRTTLATGLNNTASYAMGFSNSGTAGYIGAGYSWSGGYTFYTTVNKYAFPSDSHSTLGTGLPTSQLFNPGGMADSGTAGYTLGGGASAAGESTVVSKFAFPGDTRSTLGTGLSVVSRYGCAMADSGVAGYMALGNSYSIGQLSELDKFAFPSDSRSALTMVVDRSNRASAFANCSALAP